MGEVCVRVAVRVRPLLPKEVLHSHQVCVRVVKDGPVVMLGGGQNFSFDHAFGPSASQGQVYESCVKPLVASLVHGYNATVFAYGQTGSGKTYTLGGGHIVSLPEEKSGIIGQVATDLFVLLGEKSADDIRTITEVRVSYLELYREELRDLLELHTAHKELHIREDDRGKTVVVGAKEAVATSAEELLSILEAGNALRHIGPTQMNERSSRSHAIVTLQLTQHRPDDGSLRCSKLHLVDLAGSERAARTGNTGMRLKDSVHINTGLLALGNVIRALSDPHRRNHVPYRDAKITRLLRDSLGGSAHTLMLACVSPSHHSVTETLSVLQFASRARHVKNQPGLCPAMACQGWDSGEARLGELKQEVQTLREALRERGKTGERKFDTGEQPQYFCLAQDAALLLEEVQSSSLRASLHQRLQDWLERHEELNRSSHAHTPQPVGDASDKPHHITILQLRRELRKCQDSLAVNKQRFDQMEAELQRLQRQAQTMLLERQALVRTLQEETEHRRIQNEHLVEQQLLIDRLRGDLLTFRSGPSLETGPSGMSVKRPHSVPLIGQGQHRGGTRKIHTSPPACSLERVMAAFKTRSQLLLAQIEERDEVHCPHKAQEEEEHGGKKALRHSMNRTWTSIQTPAGSGKNWAESTRLDQSEDCPQFHQLSDFPTEGREMGYLQSLKQVETECRASLETCGRWDLHTTKEPRTVDVSVFRNGACKDSEEKLSERRVWLEQEEERALKRRRGLQELEEELRHREEVLQHREACSEERNLLKIKRLRSSQALSQDLLRVSSRLGALDQELEERGAVEGRQWEVSMEELLKERQSLRHRRDTLDSQLKDGRLLRPEEEHALLHLEEALEALDAAVEYKNRSIQERQRDLWHASEPDHGDNDCDVTRALMELSLPEASVLLVKYFNKVVCIREAEHQQRLRCEELQLQCGEQQAMIEELQAAIQRLTVDTDRRLTQLHQEHQHRIQLLLQQQIPESNSGDSDQAVRAKLQQLEKDLFYYKSSSRELKRKLRQMQLVTASLPAQGHNLQPRDSLAPVRAMEAPTLQPRDSLASVRAMEAPTLQPRDSLASEGVGEPPTLQAPRMELTPVRLSRKKLRQISSLELRNTRGHPALKASRDSFQEDSIEVPRNTD
ncbi:hypothetical protein DPEC_G00123360 [Dallia pectoralis]|uniref:Uncharacterized protein n=1 Tax=Dallia pectoralis TaxID=75939 RepID=A0ACC2GQM8_DALPE|nr:hypothetical protein DPEC_G00123360 [Dallia pectoralis]